MDKQQYAALVVIILLSNSLPKWANAVSAFALVGLIYTKA